MENKKIWPGSKPACPHGQRENLSGLDSDQHRHYGLRFRGGKIRIIYETDGLFFGAVRPGGPKSSLPAMASPGYSSILGLILIALGALMGVLAFIRYKRTERQIDDDTYHPSLILDILLTLSITAIGLFLLIYLWYSI